MLLSCAHNEERFSQQHPRNTKNRHHNEYLLQQLLERVHELIATVQRWRRRLQHHVDEHNQHRRCTTGRIDLFRRFRLIHDPLEEHHENHVSEQQHQEQHLRHELQENAARLTEMRHIDNAHDNAENHVSHTENNGQLHFVRIQEDDLIGGQLPGRIQTNRVHIVSDQIVRRRIQLKFIVRLNR